jgi:hypothetical protein
VAGHVVSIGSRTQAGQYVGGRNRIHGRQVLRSLGARGADASSAAPMRVMPHLDHRLAHLQETRLEAFSCLRPSRKGAS